MSVQFEIPKEYEVLQSPENLPPIFNGEKLVMYAILKCKKAKPKKISNCTVTLKGNMLGAQQEHKMRFVLDGSVTAPVLPVIHHLAAKALITDWGSEYKHKKGCIELSIESNVISSYTAFIAVDEESSEPVSGAMKTYDILPSDMGSSMLFASFGGGGAVKSGARKGYANKKSRAPSAPLRSRGQGKAYRMEAKGDKMAECDLLSESMEECLSESLEPMPLSSRSMPSPPGSMPTLRCSMPPPPPAGGSFGQPPASKPTDTLTGLISAQQVDGSWALNSSFAQLIGKSLPDVESACPTGVGATVWATVLAVSFLKVRYSSQQDEWELIVMKAESWLKKQSFPSGCTLDQLFQKAQ